MDEDARRRLIKLLTKHEGNAAHPYDDATGRRLKKGDVIQGNITIGIGRNLSGKGVGVREIRAMLDADLDEAETDLCGIFDHFQLFPLDAKLVLLSLRFNLGGAGFRSFKKMIAAVKQWDFREARLQMVDSAWHEQVGKRAAELEAMMAECVRSFQCNGENKL